MRLVPTAFRILDENTPSPKPAETAAVRGRVNRRHGSLAIEINIPESNQIDCPREQLYFVAYPNPPVPRSGELARLSPGNEIVRLWDGEGALQPEPFLVMLGAICQNLGEGGTVVFGNHHARPGIRLPCSRHCSRQFLDNVLLVVIRVTQARVRKDGRVDGVRVRAAVGGDRRYDLRRLLTERQPSHPD